MKFADIRLNLEPMARQAPDEDCILQRPKHCDNDNKAEEKRHVSTLYNNQ